MPRPITKCRFLRSDRNVITIKWPSSTKFLFDLPVTCPKHSSVFTFRIFTGIQLHKHHIPLPIRCYLLLEKSTFPDIIVYSFRCWDARFITKIIRPSQELYPIYYLLDNKFTKCIHSLFTLLVATAPLSAPWSTYSWLYLTYTVRCFVWSSVTTGTLTMQKREEK
jgi:hypothetical protein